ncbi:hypothetical protein BGZ83_009842 [Gryganskiella cystojenkinii]|nr:hypothetical protein BGZ83_009842 [Gryganskiella cystojenkinii]
MNTERRRTQAWTEEEDLKMLDLIKNRKRPQDIFVLFPGRSAGAIQARYTQWNSGKNMTKKQRSLVNRSSNSNETLDAATTATAPSFAVSRTESQATIDLGTVLKQERSENASSGASKKAIKPYAPLKTRVWTPEEDAVLQKHVLEAERANVRHLWSVVGAKLTEEPGWSRTLSVIKQRWKRLNQQCSLPRRWSKDESQRMLNAILEQVGPEFYPRINIRGPEGRYFVGNGRHKKEQGRVEEGRFLSKDVKAEGDSGHLEDEDNKEYKSKKKLLDAGSPELTGLNWPLIVSKVGTRSRHSIRSQFYYRHHNGNTGPWSENEVAKLREGFTRFGADWQAISTFMGTRTAASVARRLWRRVVKKGQTPV